MIPNEYIGLIPYPPRVWLRQTSPFLRAVKFIYIILYYIVLYYAAQFFVTIITLLVGEKLRIPLHTRKPARDASPLLGNAHALAARGGAVYVAIVHTDQ